MKRVRYAVLLACLCASLHNASAQDDLNIFGYFQTTFSHSNPVDSVDDGGKFNTFSVQQLNVFLSKNLSENFSAFVNLEFTNSFSSDRNWGALNLEEAWMKYYHSDAFNVKAGLLIPRFNNLNEIKNRTPLLPYIIRPLVYEASISELINLDNYVPQRAYLQVYGLVPITDGMHFDYAAYVGNSSKEYINSANGSLAVRGQDSTTYKMIGGRVGIKTSDLKVGASATYDRYNLNQFTLGDVPRVRIGGDLSFAIAGFLLEGEVILVKPTLSDENEAKLKAMSQVAPDLGESVDQTFYYANLTYNFSSQFYAFAGYSYMDDKLIKFFENGLTSLTGGIGYRPIDQVVLKGQFARYDFPDNPFTEWTVNYYYVGASVFF